ncbi:hypothetical protein C0J52_23046 [Blattella germanica]|nr:hypothetical protein C0J52_23046 [Blattella germanica]
MSLVNIFVGSSLQGPGESCGGPKAMRGICGDGMNCSCSKCTGCSLTTLECYTRHDHMIECLLNGPGEFCGGPNDVRGKCGNGMHCACSKCTGCSLATLDCYWIERDQLIDCL